MFDIESQRLIESLSVELDLDNRRLLHTSFGCNCPRVILSFHRDATVTLNLEPAIVLDHIVFIIQIAFCR